MVKLFALGGLMLHPHKAHKRTAHHFLLKLFIRQTILNALLLLKLKHSLLRSKSKK